jgi:hypothetical protein
MRIGRIGSAVVTVMTLVASCSSPAAPEPSSLYLVRPDGSGLTPLPVPVVSHPLFPDWIE